MESEGMKEVRFDLYCETCEYFNKSGVEEPCYSCLDEPCNLYSQKPVKYEEKL